VSYNIVEFAKSIKIDLCKVQNKPNLIFLCGGVIARTGELKSARDFFNRHLQRHKPALAQRVKLAEEVNAWFQKDDAFPDLLELEDYLAHLADVTVLFVESPGSIAELGAFSTSSVLRPRTLAVLNNSYGSGQSFITDGPVRKIKNENADLVHYYTWDPNDLNSAATKKEFKELTKELSDFLEARDQLKAQHVKFDSSQPGHVLLLIADLIRIPGVATKTDISDCLSNIGIDVTKEVLDRYLSVLQSVGIITRHLRSNQTFFVRADSIAFVRYRYLDSAALKDSQRIKATIHQGLEPIKRSVLRHALRASGKRRRRV